MTEQDKQQLIEQAKKLCAKHRVSIIPYGNSWWIKGSHVDFVCTDLACLKAEDLIPRRHYLRGN
jgi:hypothetical protein